MHYTLLVACYCPQTKFAKVMFLHVSVILSCLPQCMLGYPRSRHPLPGVGTPPQRADPPGIGTPPPEECMLDFVWGGNSKKFGLECSRLSRLVKFPRSKFFTKVAPSDVYNSHMSNNTYYVLDSDIGLWRLFTQKLEYSCKASCFRIL